MLFVVLAMAVCSAAPGSLPGEALFLQGDAALRAGKSADALTAFQACADADPALGPWARLRVAGIRARSGDAAAAETLYREVLSGAGGPWLRLANCRLAAMLAGMNRRDEARVLYDGALNVLPLPWFMESDAWDAADNLAADPEFLGAAAPFYQNMVETTIYIDKRKRAAKALLAMPDTAQRALGVWGLMRSGVMDEARKALLAEPVIFDEPGGQVSMQVVDTLVSAVQIPPPEAVERMGAMAKMSAANPWMRVWLIHAMRSAGGRKAWDTARIFCDILVERYGDTRDGGDALWWLAGAKRDGGDKAAAAALYRRLAEELPAHPRAADAWFALGDNARGEHRWADALAAFTELGKRHGDTRLAAEAYCACADISRQIGDADSERMYLERAAKGGTGNYYAHRALGRLQQNGGDEKEKGRVLAVAGDKPFLGLFPGQAADPSGTDTDTALARMRFFGINGLEEGEWEALDCLLRAGDDALRAARYQALAEAGFMHTAAQFARAARAGKPADAAASAAMTRLEYPIAYGPILKPTAEAAAVDPWLVLAVARQESTFRSGIVSKSGATGVMQLMPATAKWLAKKNPMVQPDDAENLGSPVSSLRMGAAYLHQMLERSGGNMVFALASYNAGPGNCDKWRKSFSGDDMDAFIEAIPFAETKDYVKRVLGNYAAYHTLHPLPAK
jgi:soluble lytic murein transglycosylase-like protein